MKKRQDRRQDRRRRKNTEVERTSQNDTVATWQGGTTKHSKDGDV